VSFKIVSQDTVAAPARSKAGLVAAALVLLSVSASSAQAPQQHEAASYDELVARAKAGDANVDYLALRNAYAESPGYDPYGSKLREPEREMLDAYGRGDCAVVIAKAESILAVNFVHAEAHLAAGLCHGKLGNEEAMRRERTIVRGLIDSILTSGDGKSEQTAFVVVQIAEEYTILKVLGLRRVTQALIHAQGHSYDRFETKSNDTGQEGGVFFNIDRLLAVLDRELRPHKP
jgi:hypothetical protein